MQLRWDLCGCALGLMWDWHMTGMGLAAGDWTFETGVLGLGVCNWLCVNEGVSDGTDSVRLVVWDYYWCGTIGVGNVMWDW